MKKPVLHSTVYGRCIKCDRYTKEQNRFSDDTDDTVGYAEWCHDDCFEVLLEKL